MPRSCRLNLILLSFSDVDYLRYRYRRRQMIRLSITAEVSRRRFIFGSGGVLAENAAHIVRIAGSSFISVGIGSCQKRQCFEADESLARRRE